MAADLNVNLRLNVKFHKTERASAIKYVSPYLLPKTALSPKYLSMSVNLLSTKYEPNSISPAEIENRVNEFQDIFLKYVENTKRNGY